jgi:hypothetical protein
MADAAAGGDLPNLVAGAGILVPGDTTERRRGTREQEMPPREGLTADCLHGEFP